MDNIERIERSLNEVHNLHDTPPWVKILIGCLHEIVSAVKDIHSLPERLNKLEDVSCVREQIIESLRDDNKNLKN